MRNEEVRISQSEIQARAQALGFNCEVYDAEGFALTDNGKGPYLWTNGELLGQVEYLEEIDRMPPPTLKDRIQDFCSRFW